MSHDVLLAIALLVSIGPLMLLGAWSRVQLHNLPPRQLNREALEILLNGCVKRWVVLLKAVEDKSPQDAIDKKASEVYEYLRDNVRYL